MYVAQFFFSLYNQTSVLVPSMRTRERLAMSPLDHSAALEKKR